MNVIVAINKNKIVVVQVNSDGKKIVDGGEYGWTPETLDLVFSEIIKKFKGSKVRLLISDELSYVVRLAVPADITREKERDYIWRELQGKVPEELGEADWDYKEIEVSEKQKTQIKDVIVFALVKDFYKVLTEAVIKSALQIEAVEPETISKTRNANPVLGLALKEDLTGRDEDVLNLKMSLRSSDADKLENISANGSSEEAAIQSKPDSKFRKLFFYFLLVLLIANLSIAGLWLYKTYLSKLFKTQVQLATSSSSKQDVSETPAASSAPSPTEAVNLGQYKILVQNGAGISGVADKVINTLRFEGFKDLTSGNADTFDYQKTEVKMKRGIPKMVYDVIDKALNSDYQLELLSEQLGDSSPYDVVITVGKQK